jgi:hypothetical protein
VPLTMGLPLQMAGSILIFSQTAESDGRTAIPFVNLFSFSTKPIYENRGAYRKASLFELSCFRGAYPIHLE